MYVCLFYPLLLQRGYKQEDRVLAKRGPFKWVLKREKGVETERSKFGGNPPLETTRAVG